MGETLASRATLLLNLILTMGGAAAGKGFEYQDMCALQRAIQVYEPNSSQLVQVENLHSPAGQREEPWDFRILNPACATDWDYKEELWQAKDTTISKNQCCVYWKGLHKWSHNGSLECSEKSRSDVILGIVTSRRLNRQVERFRQFTECLRSYHQTPERSDLKEVIKEDFMGVNLDEFAELLTGGKAQTLSLFDFNAKSQASIYWFRHFLIEEFNGNSVRDRTLLNCVRRLGMRLPDSDDAYDLVCGPPLSLIRKNYGKRIPIDDLVASLNGDFRQSQNPRTIVSEVLKIQKSFVLSVPSGGANISKLFVEPFGTSREAGTSAIHEDDIAVLPWLLNALSADDCSLVLVLGDFGHGKTTLLKFAAAKLADKWRPGEPIPVFIPLRRFFEESRTVQDLVADSVADIVPLTQEMWRENKWQIFCDGFDELNALHQDRPDWVRGRFDKLYRESQSDRISIALSSRPILFLDPEMKEACVSSFDRILISPFGETEISQWLKNNGDTIKLNDLKNRGILEVASIPVILSLISQLERAGVLQNKKYRRVEVYKEFFRWVAKTGGSLDAKEVRRKHKEIPEVVLHKIALLLFSHEEAQSGLMGVKLLLHELENDGFSFDERLFVRHAFHEGKPEYVEFLHQSLREYLVAEYCFNSIFTLDDEGDIFPEFRNLLFEKHLTQAKIGFFKELVEAHAEEEQNENIFSQVWDWPKILWLFQYQNYADTRAVAKQLSKDDEAAIEICGKLAFNSYSDRDLDRISVSSGLQIPLGNLSLLMFLARTFYLQATGSEDTESASELISLIKFLNSYNELEPLSQILKHSLGGIQFAGSRWPIEENHFKNFQFEKNRFIHIRFESCSFENSTFQDCVFERQTNLVKCNFRDCSFDRCEFLSGVCFYKCWFDSESVFANTKEDPSIKFEKCIFAFSESKIDLPDNKFVDCYFLDGTDKIEGGI